MKKITLLLFLAVFTICNLSAQKLTDPINNDPNVKIGKLSNGLTYYIRENQKPEKRAEFWLLVNVGSMQENDDQLGLAHFTEHMGFNGIKGFPGNSITDELAKIGVTFGIGIGAWTSFDETYYTMTMPTDDPKNIEMAMNILKGWANDYLLDNKEIDQERGIIIEEYRFGLGADDRMRKKWFPVVFNGSRYADRLPIGTLEVLENFKHQTLKDFYYDWYRPDLQAIVVVGDINAADIEKMIISKFGKIKPKKNPREKIMYPISPNKEPMAVVCTDKEAGYNSIMMLRKFPHFVMKTVGDFKIRMMHELYNLMYDARIGELLQNPNTPFLGASIGYEPLIGNTDAYFAQVTAKENQIKASLEVVMKEDYRVLKFGFLDTELKRAKEELLNQYELKANEVGKTESAVFARDYWNHFLRQDPIPGAKRVFNYAKKYLEEITLEEVNALAAQWITKENLCVVVTAPEKEGVIVPTEKEILAIVNDKSLENVHPYIDTYKEQEMVEKESLQKGSIVAENKIVEVGVTELTLSNGITVWLKKTDFKNDQILFRALSKGGACLYDEADLASCFFATSFVDRAGINEIDYISLTKKMKGKQVKLTSHIKAFLEEMEGEATPKDLEFFFQYLHAFYATPRYDKSVYELVTKEFKEQMKMLEAMPMYRALIQITRVVTQNDYYSPVPLTQLTLTDEFVNTADYDKAFEIYKERFANPADFIFTFVGNFDEKIIREYLELYVASLPTSPDRDKINPNVVKGFPKEQLTKDIYFGTEEQAFVGITFQKEFPWTLENKAILSALNDALDIELIAEIREKMSAVYSPICILNWEKIPKSEYFLMVLLGCAPNNTDNLTNAVLNILKDMQENGPSETTMEKVKQQLLKQRETSMKTNEFWRSILSNMWLANDNVKTIPDFAENINKVTSRDIADFLKKYLDLEHFVRVNLYPEK
ncbi:MAG: insulinase family protein [Lentimicrobiaceae bacterium]|nr:insulinase family protein [Lentimicrobiaceae bacterium]